MSTYQVTVEQITLVIAQVSASGVHEAAVKALAGEGVLIDTKVLSPKVRPPKKLRRKAGCA